MTAGPRLVERPVAGVVVDAGGAMDPRLAASYAGCVDVVRTRARNFYYGLKLTPEPRRSAVYAIYAWMREADDRVDAHADPVVQRRELDAFRELTFAALRGDDDRQHGTGASGHQTRDGFWPALAHTVRTYNVPHEYLHDMLDGMDEDIGHTGYDTLEQLERYCYRVASTVGLVCVRIWGLRPGVEESAAAEMARRRGLAFQLTNILRDVGQDYDASPRRVYVPADMLARHGLTAGDLRAWSDAAKCRAAVLELATRASDHYAASAGLEDLIEPGCRPTLWAMTRIYRGLLDIVLDDPSRVVGSKRIRLSGYQKVYIALRASLLR
ncbi:MAG: phytoene/squalene synthase family protein [Planctomyces sp.]|jgi:phytoene synthase|nr:squalene/phytoene synthase family protein [Phycisphaeraceae bacterium]